MSKSLELVQLAKEGNASRFGDSFAAGIQERVIAGVSTMRSTLFASANVTEGKNPFAKDDDKDDDKDEKDKDDKSSDKDKDDGDKEKDDDEDA